MTRIKLVYLIENKEFEPWFIGTENCVLKEKEDQTIDVSTTDEQLTTKSPKSPTKIPLVNRQKSSQQSLIPSPYALNESAEIKKQFHASSRAELEHPAKQTPTDYDSYAGFKTSKNLDAHTPQKHTRRRVGTAVQKRRMTN